MISQILKEFKLRVAPASYWLTILGSVGIYFYTGYEFWAALRLILWIWCCSLFSLLLFTYLQSLSDVKIEKKIFRLFVRGRVTAWIFFCFYSIGPLMLVYPEWREVTYFFKGFIPLALCQFMAILIFGFIRDYWVIREQTSKKP
jgi:hypothetical protein